ncbi:hypothetical protein HK405_000553 [Cladochytrium tenue]|nr:hypothetical protein HK405_000553 [Cladochytrium tenue]
MRWQQQQHIARGTAATPQSPTTTSGGTFDSLLAEIGDLIGRSSGDRDAEHTRLDRGHDGPETNEDDEDDDDDDDDDNGVYGKADGGRWGAGLLAPMYPTPPPSLGSVMAAHPSAPRAYFDKLPTSTSTTRSGHSKPPRRRLVVLAGRRLHLFRSASPTARATSTYVLRRDSDVATMADTGGGGRQTVLTLRTERDVGRAGGSASARAWRLRGEDEDVVTDWLVHVEAVIEALAESEAGVDGDEDGGGAAAVAAVIRSPPPPPTTRPFSPAAGNTARPFSPLTGGGAAMAFPPRTHAPVVRLPDGRLASGSPPPPPRAFTPPPTARTKTPDPAAAAPYHRTAGTDSLASSRLTAATSASAASSSSSVNSGSTSGWSSGSTTAAAAAAASTPIYHHSTDRAAVLHANVANSGVGGAASGRGSGRGAGGGGGDRRGSPVVSPVPSSASASPQPTSRSPPPKNAGTPPAGFSRTGRAPGPPPLPRTMAADDVLMLAGGGGSAAVTGRSRSAAPPKDRGWGR